MSAPPVLNPDTRKSYATLLKERIQGVRSGAEAGSLYQQLRDRLRQVTIDGVVLYVAEGDTLLDEDQLWLYALNRERVAREEQDRNLAGAGGLATAAVLQPPRQPSGLLGLVDENGNFIRWDEGTVLSYCVLKATFSGPNRDAHHALVVESMRKAAEDWQNACNVRFKHLNGLDESELVRPDGVVFLVRELDTGGAFIAAAFFPNDPLERRRVVIDPSYYAADLGFDRVGVLRHELGHVLGFRHEHIRSGAPVVCPQEDSEGTIDLTRYDPQSVMHYFCGGVGSRELSITTLDFAGAQRLYGPPVGPAGLLVDGVNAMARQLQPLPTAVVR